MIYRAFGKRVFDIFFSLAALTILSPLLMMVAFVIGAFDGRPVIFQQKRVGRNRELFTLYKFRSMPGSIGDIPSDKVGEVKISRVGQFIRRTNIDELPQFFNVLRGDMSIVGPRPPIACQVDLIEARAENGALSCRPGVTGLAQIRSFDGMTVSHKATLDGNYARSITLISDLKIILSTFSYLLRPPPIY
jgi:O-antigen biosynthesis protein WbqP